jgi:hypothetical protein
LRDEPPVVRSPRPAATAAGERRPEANVLAYDYPLLGAMWTMLVFFLWIAWLFLLFRIFGDIFRDSSLGGVAKALWIIGLIFLPFLGAFIYVCARGNAMTERDIAAAQANKAAFDSYVRDTAGSGGGTADELQKLAGLRDSGVITEAEFAAQKARVLG